MTAELEFFTRERCSLCDDALAKVRPLARIAGVRLIVRNAADAADPALAARVPVLSTGAGIELHSGPLTWPAALRCVARARVSRS